jgi:hypothetical protein
MGSEGMSQGMAACGLSNGCPEPGFFESSLQNRFVKVVAICFNFFPVPFVSGLNCPSTPQLKNTPAWPKASGAREEP